MTPDPVQAMLDLSVILNTAVIVLVVFVGLGMLGLYAAMRRAGELDQEDEDNLGIRRS